MQAKNAYVVVLNRMHFRQVAQMLHAQKPPDFLALLTGTFLYLIPPCLSSVVLTRSSDQWP